MFGGEIDVAEVRKIGEEVVRCDDRHVKRQSIEKIHLSILEDEDESE